MWLNCVLTWISISFAFQSRIGFRKLRDDIIVKFSNEMYDELNKQGVLQEYKHKIIKFITKNHQLILRNEENSNDDHKKGLLKSSYHNYLLKPPTMFTSDLRFYSSELTTKQRTINLYISMQNQCDVNIYDTVTYVKNPQNETNFLEHIVLNNNVDYIDPHAVYSSDANINFFSYYRKLNLFSVNFDLKNSTSSEFTMEYNYRAVNLIKSNEGNNTIMWKFLNENNSSDRKEKITLRFHFSIPNFEKEEIAFSSFNFTKSIEKDKVVYTYEGEINPREVIIIFAKFPKHIEDCLQVKINIPMVIIGSLFILMLILALYLIISHLILKEDL